MTDREKLVQLVTKWIDNSGGLNNKIICNRLQSRDGCNEITDNQFSNFFRRFDRTPKIESHYVLGLISVFTDKQQLLPSQRCTAQDAIEFCQLTGVPIQKIRQFFSEDEYNEAIEDEFGVDISLSDENNEDKSESAGSVYKEFGATINRATADFVGRENIFNEMDEFIQKESCGYMIIEGHPGMGKTAIMARYFQKKNCVVYFNIRGQRDRSNDFMESIQEQLIHRYAISPPAEHDKPAEKLNKLFLAASSSLKPNEKLIILIDALDEVSHSPDPGGNLLHLPRDLPQRVYIIMTKRPERLPLPSPKADIDLLDEAHQEASKKDVERYIRHHLVGKNRQVYLDWMARQDDLTEEGFVQTLMEKSENNFMYLHYIMHEIGKEKSVYQNLKIERLPAGLKEYYETHWDLMAMTRTKTYIVYTICEAGIATADMITEYVQPHDETIDTYTVEEVLEGWINFLYHWLWDNEWCYRIYHESFRDFLSNNPKVKAVEMIIGDVNANIGLIQIKKLKELMGQ